MLDRRPGGFQAAVDGLPIDTHRLLNGRLQ
jgi:hypothetical protein